MRLIDADALCEEFKKRQQAALRWKEKALLDGDEERSIRADATLAFLSEVKLTIDNAPTVEERPQGEWMKIEAPSYTIIRCTCCGYKDNAIYIPNFCPNCGADMREEEKT